MVYQRCRSLSAAGRGLPATGRRFEYAGAAFFTADDQWLTSAGVLGDLDGLRRQLG
jgi:hypothetical protein